MRLMAWCNRGEPLGTRSLSACANCRRTLGDLAPRFCMHQRGPVGALGLRGTGVGVKFPGWNSFDPRSLRRQGRMEGQVPRVLAPDFGAPPGNWWRTWGYLREPSHWLKHGTKLANSRRFGGRLAAPTHSATQREPNESEHNDEEEPKPEQDILNE